MSEGIEFDPLGSVTVTFDDKSYRLGRPKMGQWRYFQRLLRDMSREAEATLTELREKVEKASPKNQALAEAELRAFAEEPFYEKTIPWIGEVFKQLGDNPLPEDPDDWPAWLAADTGLPIQIVNHWKTTPKASG